MNQFQGLAQIKDSALKELDLLEDQAPYTIPDISDFFEDPDGDDLVFDLGSEIQPEYNSPSGLLKCMYDDTDHSTKIIPQTNEYGFDQIPVRVYDGATYRVTHKINVTVAPINDAPWIHNTGNEDDWNNNSFLLRQDTRFRTDIDASDVEDDTITFSIDFPDMSKNLFEINETSGEIDFTPSNENKGNHKAIISVTDQNETNGESSKTFWFNISNINDPPRFLKIGKYTIDEGINDLVFNMTEHEWLNFTIIATDPDIDIGIQESVFFSSDMSKMNESFFIIEDRVDPTKAEVSFWAHGVGILCTVPEKGYGPQLGKLTVTDSNDHTLKSTINISIGIENVNDPPTRARIDSPENNDTFLEMEVEFVAGIVTDPDQIYGDELTYVWDFDDSDGINDHDGNGTQPTYIFEENGDYVVTLHIFDSENLTSAYAQVLVHIQGDASGLDADKDGLPNDWEDQWGLDKYNADGDDGRMGDPDGDGVVNYREMELFTDPLDEDTDGDGVWDGEDEYPGDSKRWKKAEAETDWTWLIILLVIIAVVLIVLVILVVLVVLVASKRKKEEDEAQAIAEAAAQDEPYGQQELYSDVAQVQQQMPPPQQPVPQPTGGESLDFERPEGLEPVEGDGPPGPDSQLPPGGQPQAALPPGPDEGAPPGMEGEEGPPPGMEEGPPPGAEGPPPDNVGMPPQDGPGAELQPPPSLPPGSENP